MSEVELQLFSISSTAKQLVQDVEYVRAEDVRGFVEGVRALAHGGQVVVCQGQGSGEGGQVQGGGGQQGGGGGGGTVVQVRLDRGRGDVGRRLNYLMVTAGAGQSQGQGQQPTGQQPTGQAGQVGQQAGQPQGQQLGHGLAGQEATMAGEGQGHGRSSRRSSTRGQAPPTPTPSTQSQVQSYIAAQAVAAMNGQAVQPQQADETGWSPANASAASSAGRASPGPSEGKFPFRSSLPIPVF